jgi:hypothetical protein
MRARRRSFFWRALQWLPLALAPLLLVSFGRQQPAFNLGVSMLFLLVGLGNLLVADRIDALLELLEVRGLLDETPPPSGPSGGSGVSRGPTGA